MTASIEELVTFLVATSKGSSSYLLRTTCVWALEKLLPSFDRNPNVVAECIAIAQSKDFHQLNHHKNVALMMYQEACISLLDEIVEN